jgi:transcriptional regulator with XRE-family HTH domain
MNRIICDTEYTMPLAHVIHIELLGQVRRALGLSHAAVAARSGVSEPTVKRILGGHASEASFANVIAVARALGVGIDFERPDIDELRRRQARMKAEQVAKLVQGTSALEDQAVDDATYRQIVEKTYHELLAGSPRRLWSA